MGVLSTEYMYKIYMYVLVGFPVTALLNFNAKLVPLNNFGETYDIPVVKYYTGARRRLEGITWHAHIHTHTFTFPSELQGDGVFS